LICNRKKKIVNVAIVWQKKKKKTSGNPKTNKTKDFGTKSIMIIIIIVWVDFKQTWKWTFVHNMDLELRRMDLDLCNAIMWCIHNVE